MLSWTGGDPNSGDTVSYDVYLGTTATPTIKVSANQSSTMYNPGILSYLTRYYWRIVAWDNHGTSTVGPIWHFTTVSTGVNNPPNLPTTPNPANGATTVDLAAQLSWVGGDPDQGDAAIYDVYFGSANPPIKVIGNQSNTTYDPGTLSYGTQYYWRIIAWDTHGASRIGPLWSFTTVNAPSGGGGGGGGSQNLPPIADASAGAPYEGLVGENIVFNGSRSHDPDGTIIRYTWNFGDGTTGSGKTVTHAYNTKGTFTVVLSVQDNQGAIGTTTVQAFITAANHPPIQPTFGGPTMGTKNVSYEYSVVSSDTDNDTIQYRFDWGDGLSTTTGFLSSGIPTMAHHQWTSTGDYRVTITATDNTSASASSTLRILIDMWYVNDLGYLVDQNGDGTYDVFYSNTTGKQTRTELHNGSYYLDLNGDGTWDNIYNPITGELTKYVEKPVTQKATDNLLLFGILLGIVIILVLLIFATPKKKSPMTNEPKQHAPAQPAPEPAALPPQAPVVKKPVKKPASKKKTKTTPKKKTKK
jgi:hypothetical protein